MPPCAHRILCICCNRDPLKFAAISVEFLSATLLRSSSLSLSISFATDMSGAGPRSIGDAASSSSSSAVKPKKEGSAKKKTKTTKAASSAASASSPKKAVDLAAASSSDAATLALHASQTAQAHRSAFPFLTAEQLADDDADEEEDEEKLAAEMADLLKEEAAPEARPLTLEIIRQKCLPPEVLASDDQELMSGQHTHKPARDPGPGRRSASKRLFQLDRLHLDGQSLSSIDDSFDVMSHSLTHIYLQRNALTSTAGFASLRALRFLTLSHNQIVLLEGLGALPKLQFLDVSFNCIEELDTGSEDGSTECQLPESLVVLNVAHNPFALLPDAREHIVTVSPYLKTLDGRRVTNKERREYGLEADDDDTEDEAAAAAAAAASAAKSGAGAADDDDEDEEEADEPDDDDEDGAMAAYALRAQAEEIRKRSEQRTMLYDTSHGVTAATTKQDRADAAAAAAAAAKKS